MSVLGKTNINSAELGERNIFLAYVLWFLLGGLGAHRLYLGQAKTAFIFLMLFIVGWLFTYILIGIIPLLIVLVWWIIDIFLIPGMVDAFNKGRVEVPSTFAFKTPGGASANYSDLETLHGLYEKGIITQEQFEVRRDKIMKES